MSAARNSERESLAALSYNKILLRIGSDGKERKYVPSGGLF
jgi:hypothetical protein